MKLPSKAKSKFQSESGSLHFPKAQLFSEMVGGIAHDLNNLLTIFQGYTELLEMEIGPDDPRSEFLSEMAAAVERGRTLASQLLHFSRKRKSHREVTALDGLLRDYQKFLRRVVPEEIELTLRIEEETGFAMLDPREMETLVVYLLVNACEKLPSGGGLEVGLASTSTDILLTVSTSEIDPEKSQQRESAPDQPEEKPDADLTICHEIVEKCGGKFTVQEPCGGGIAFQICLPRIASSSRDIPSSSPDSPALPSGKGEKILVVEDDLPTQKTLAAVLSGLGYHPICAANGDEALKILKKESQIRLVITDLVMPLMGGTELAVSVRKHWPEIQIVFTSGYTFEFKNTDLTQHSTFFLPKPIPRSILANTLRELLNP